MKAWIIDGAFGLENLKLVERPKPSPGWGEVLIKMEAASINYRDLMMIQGRYNPKQPLPLVPCSDGYGVVDAVGEGVNVWRQGDRVIPVFMQEWFDGERPSREVTRTSLGGPVDGTMSQWMVVPSHALVRAPETMSGQEAATLPCAALTAWSALSMGEVCAGETVLVQGTGGVSLFALQLAKLRGAKVVVTSSQDDKLERAMALGADEGVNYVTTPQWGKEVAKRVPGGVDHIIEVGGAGTLEQSLRAIRIGGRISLIGVLSGGKQPINIIPILMQNVRVQGVLVGHRAGLEQMIKALDFHEVKPVISDTFSFEQLPQALAHMKAQKHFGKIALTF